MKFARLLSVVFIFLALNSFAQKDDFFAASRFDVDEALAPFYHGVASGDPLSDAVIIWTRVSTDSMSATVKWQVATDTAMMNVVAEGWATTDGELDFTIKVDVTGLSPYTTYYYDFLHDQDYSLRGRTKTAPAGTGVDSLRFGVVSCSNFAHGYFNVYDKLVDRNDIDAVIHLGDYIYEYANGEYGDVREYEPSNEIITLSDYRMRHSYYKLDPQLRRLHQQYAIIPTWDDHESANNAWFGGAENHNSGEGDWFDRKGYSVKSYHEWMPLRTPDVSNEERIYRKISYGDLMELYMLDTRLIGRDEQDGTGNNDPNRSILGSQQFTWLTTEMQNSPAKWHVLGQQVMMAPLEVFGNGVNEDQWDGYSAERNNLYNAVLAGGVPNMVILTGDIHTSWANDLPRSSYNPDTGANSAGVEFVTTSVTSPGLPLPGGEAFIMGFNDHIKHANLADRGYFVLDVNQTRAQANYYTIDNVSDASANQSFETAWYTNDGTRHLQGGSESFAGDDKFTTYAPEDPRIFSFGVSNEDLNNELAFVGVHPNPAKNELYLQFFNHGDLSLGVSVFDATGRQVLQQDLGLREAGLQNKTLDISALPAGTYFVVLQTEKGSYRKTMVKQ